MHAVVAASLAAADTDAHGGVQSSAAVRLWPRCHPICPDEGPTRRRRSIGLGVFSPHPSQIRRRIRQPLRNCSAVARHSGDAGHCQLHQVCTSRPLQPIYAGRQSHIFTSQRHPSTSSPLCLLDVVESLPDVLGSRDTDRLALIERSPYPASHATMTRGRRKDLTIPPSRALLQQRDYRARKAQYVADLEDRVRKVEEENTRLKKENDILRMRAAAPGQIGPSPEVVRKLVHALHGPLNTFDFAR
jgi:hypothetical protein